MKKPAPSSSQEQDMHPGVKEHVTELKGFATPRGCCKYFYLLAPSKGDSQPKLCLPEGRLNHCLHILLSQLHVDFFFAVGYT